MYARKSLAVSLIISLTIIILGGCHAPSKPEIEWSNQWGNISGNILEDGYVAANGNTVCYASLNEAADALYSLSETGEITLISRKAAYNLNIVDNQVYFTNGLPGSICRIDIDGTNFKTLVRGEYLTSLESIQQPLPLMSADFFHLMIRFCLSQVTWRPAAFIKSIQMGQGRNACLTDQLYAFAQTAKQYTSLFLMM